MTQQPPHARHILTFAQTLDGGGVERAMLRLAGLWVARGRRVTIVVGRDGGALAGEVPAGAIVIELGDARYTTLTAAVPRLVRDLAPDILFCPGNHYTGVAAWAKLRLGRACPPIVGKVSNALVRRDHGWRSLPYRAWLFRHPSFLDAVVAMSPNMAVEAVAEMGVARARVHVIPNPPALPDPHAPPLAMPPRYLIGVGRLAQQKRWDRALDALAQIADRTIPLVILGEGPLRAAIVAQAAVLGLADRVFLPGHAADPIPAIAGADLLLLTSEFEGVPGVLREALSVGTPVVTTDSSVAVGEIVADPARGSVVAVGDAPALVAAIDDWLAGRSRPEPLVDTGDPAADYLRLFDSLVSSPAS